MQPLGMQDSRASEQRLPPDAERALPYIDGVAAQDHAFVTCKPAAAIYASAHDLSAWIAMLVSGGAVGTTVLVDPAALGELWQTKIGSLEGTAPMFGHYRAYGMGWFLSLEGSKRLVGNEGGTPGFRSTV